MRVTASRSFRYDGKRYAPGSEFEMQAKHVRIFTATRDVTIVDTSTEEKPAARRGRYRRRDMRADGDGA